MAITYDIGMKRNTRIRKICRKYLCHVQKSVFEGDISEKNFSKMKSEIKRIINCDDDQVAIYVFDSLRYASKEIIGYHIDSDNII